MSGKPEVQEQYLNDLRTSQRPARIVLLDGRELHGTVEAFDAFTIRLNCKGDNILVFKGAIAVMGPSESQAQTEE